MGPGKAGNRVGLEVHREGDDRHYDHYRSYGEPEIGGHAVPPVRKTFFHDIASF